MSRESLSDQTKRTAKILAKLKALYPGARTALRHRDPLQMLVATILSAQTTDVSVNKATPALFERYPTPADLASADQLEVEEYVRTLGFYHQKAKNIIATARCIVAEFGGEARNDRPTRADAVDASPAILCSVGGDAG